MEYNNNLLEYRVDSKYSQEQLAIEVNCSRRTVGNIEMGKNIPSVTLAYRIAAKLNKPVTDIFPPEDGVPIIEKDKENSKSND